MGCLDSVWKDGQFVHRLGVLVVGWLGGKVVESFLLVDRVGWLGCCLVGW